jgi:hypothetical protein
MRKSMKKKFIESKACNSGLHCHLCRKLHSGADWRRQLEKVFELPDDDPDFKCPYGKDWEKEGRISTAISSTIKTQVFRKDRTSEIEYEERMAICDGCEHVTRNRRGRIHTCGPMLQSLMDPNVKTCGCVLRAKARDKKQKCPFGYWPDLD